jgi:hypothetical protein
MVIKSYGENSCDLEPPSNVLTVIQHLILENMDLFVTLEGRILFVTKHTLIINH